MARFFVENVRVAGVAAAVPREEEREPGRGLFSESELRLYPRTVGVDSRRRVAPGQTAGDLCQAAARALLKELGWEPSSVTALVLVTQSPDRFLPATACLLQDKLGLPETALCYDMRLGCSGFVYGLSSLAPVMAAGGAKRALLLAGEAATPWLSPRDKTSYPLFGDAGTATALEFSPGAPPMHFALFTKGSGWDAVTIPDGGGRSPACAASLECAEAAPGVFRRNLDLALNGTAVFSFSIQKAPELVREILDFAQADILSTDYFVFHQANRLIHDTIVKKLGIPPEKAPLSLPGFGNTSSASIPLTLVTALSRKLAGPPLSLVLAGFGAGFSYGAAHIKAENLAVPPLQEV